MTVNLQKAEFVLSAVSPKHFIQDGLPQVEIGRASCRERVSSAV